MSLAPLPFRALSHGILSSSPLRKLNSAVLKPRFVNLLCAILCCPQDLELHHFMVTAVKADLELHIPVQYLLVGENGVQHNTSPHRLLSQLEKEVVIVNIFQEHSGLLMFQLTCPLNRYQDG